MVGAGAAESLGLGAPGAGGQWSGRLGPAGAPAPGAVNEAGSISAAGEVAAPLAPPRMAASDPPFVLAAGRSPMADPAMPGEGAPERSGDAEGERADRRGRAAVGGGQDGAAEIAVGADAGQSAGGATWPPMGSLPAASREG